MLYFIPAWYHNDTWHENEQKWHSRRVRTEFDDTVKQIQLFNRNGDYKYSIIVLSYAPNLRHFLHRQGVFHAPYWSAFDAIQEVKKKQIYVLSFRNLKWPEGIEFVYTPFVIVAYLDNEKYAQIEFGEDGNPIQVDMFHKERLIRTNYYDDRGFLSSTVKYENDKEVIQDYLMDNGIWKLRQYLDDGHVEINPDYRNYLIQYEGRDYRYEFKELSYNDLDSVIREVLTAYIRKTDYDDIFCAAMHERHLSILRRALWDKKKVLSFFEDRVDIDRNKKIYCIMKKADFIIADSKLSVSKIKTRFRNIDRERIIDITPYDSRVDFGISQQLNVQKILFPIDGLPDKIFRRTIIIFAEYLKKNPHAEIDILTRLSDYNLKSDTMKRISKVLKRAVSKEEWEKYNEMQKVDLKGENGIIDEIEAAGETEKLYSRFIVNQCVDELSVSKCMREQRIMVDLRSIPALYLQISCISTGIPQIVRRKTEYVENGKNGYIIKDVDELPKVLDFCLDGLKNWNDAMINAYELGKYYTTENILEKWRGVIETIGKDKGVTDGKQEPEDGVQDIGYGGMDISSVDEESEDTV
ncbi:MAG: accessory Sec system protein Asp1 [Lachnospiraceae bacterium]|nr:accessory Sec system protein Asp1 [Lachnospiraceae bacterium]